MTSPNRRPEYEARRSTLDDRLKLALDLVEESIIVDAEGTHRRRLGPNGTVIDLSAYDEFGLLVSYLPDGPDGPEFVEFVIWSG